MQDAKYHDTEAILKDIANVAEYDEEENSSVDSLIDYKNAVEDLACQFGGALERIAAGAPREDEWRSAANFMEYVAEVIDTTPLARPRSYDA